MSDTPQAQITNVFNALTGLINTWNDAADDGDRGRDNAMLVLTLWDDGSGRIGTAHGYERDDGAFCDVSMNIQTGWNDIPGFASFLLEWVNTPAASLTPEHYAALLDRDAALRRAEMAESDNAALRTAIESFLAANTYSTIGSRRARLRQLARDAHPGQALLAELEAARAENAYLRGWIRSECSVADADINEAMAVDAAKAAKKGTTS